MSTKAAATAPKTEMSGTNGNGKAHAPDIDTSSWDDANVNIDAWYAPETSGRLVGRVVEAIRVQSEFGEQDVVKIKSAIAVKALRGKGSAAETVELPAGSVVAVRISANLAILLELVENQCAVEIKPQGQVALKGGKKMWRYGVKFKGERSQLKKSPPLTNESAKGDEGLDDLPF